MSPQTIVSTSEARTLRLGEELGASLRPPAVILLEGELGSGKTVLARGLARGLGIDDPSQVRSPTYTIVHQHQTRSGLLYHLDLYRLQTRRELDSIGLSEILASEAVIIIEWAQKLPVPVPGAIRIRLSRGSRPQVRRLRIETPFQSS